MAVAPRPSLFTQIQRFGSLGNQQKLGLIVGLAAAIALIVGGWIWAQTPNYRVLFANVSERDGGPILTALQQMNVPYKVADGGGAILVPETQVYEVRLRLASQGLPKGGAVGFELLENQKLGTSQFVEQVNYQRALEGELTRSIESLDAVQAARVHLAIPKPSVFVRDQQKPSASVLVQLRGGRTLDAGQVSGIVHLVASSVPDLPVKNVTILDQNGNLLSAGNDKAPNVALDPGQLEYAQAIEQTLARRVESIIAPIVGPGSVRAQVTADVDFSQTEQTAETYRPNPAPQAAIRSQQTVENNGGTGSASGVPGALSNQPPGAASAPINATAGPGAAGAAGAAATATAAAPSRREVTVNYELDKTIRHTKQPVGLVRRISAAVVVDYRKAVGRDGKKSYKPLTSQEIAQINNLAREAIGFSAQRGDTLNVVNAPFSISDSEEVAATPLWKDPSVIGFAKELGKNVLIAALVLYLILGVLRPLLRELARPPKVAPVPAGLDVAIGRPVANASYDQNLQAAKEMARKDPAVVANVVKDWVGKDE